MGTISITNQAVKSDAFISDLGTNDDGCQGVKSISIVVPTGTTKHVLITPSENNASPTVNTTITQNTLYNLTIIGDNSTGKNITTTINVVVRDGNSSGPVEATENYSRQHSGNIC